MNHTAAMDSQRLPANGGRTNTITAGVCEGARKRDKESNGEREREKQRGRGREGRKIDIARDGEGEVERDRRERGQRESGKDLLLFACLR